MSASETVFVVCPCCRIEQRVELDVELSSWGIDVDVESVKVSKKQSTNEAQETVDEAVKQMLADYLADGHRLVRAGYSEEDAYALGAGPEVIGVMRRLTAERDKKKGQAA